MPGGTTGRRALRFTGSAGRDGRDRGHPRTGTGRRVKASDVAIERRPKADFTGALVALDQA